MIKPYLVPRANVVSDQPNSPKFTLLIDPNVRFPARQWSQFGATLKIVRLSLLCYFENPSSVRVSGSMYRTLPVFVPVEANTETFWNSQMTDISRATF